MIKLDDWQRAVLETSGNIVLRSGRQCGKSTVISQKAAQYATSGKGKTVLVIASVERQALLLFEKILSYLYEHHRKLIMRGKDKPTKHKIMLSNGSTIYCLPTGLSGYGIRGYTIDLLIADEAAFIPEEVWTAVTPMLAVTKGDIILLSTPFGKGGYFYRCFSDDTFTSFHVSSEDCSRIDSTFLCQERERMTKVQYAQEYLGEFVDELMQFFPSELIARVTVIQEGVSIGHLLASSSCDNYLGADIARMGRDETVLDSLALEDGNLRQIDHKITSKTFLTDTVEDIKRLDTRYDYKRIYIDDGGLGVGVFDPLLLDSQTKRKVVAINNSSRALDNDKKRKKLLKEDLYNNLRVLMEQGRIQLFDRDDIRQSLRCVQVEYTSNGMRLFGNYTHIVEALIRAAWCVRDKRLNIWIR